MWNSAQKSGEACLRCVAHCFFTHTCTRPRKRSQFGTSLRFESNLNPARTLRTILQLFLTFTFLLQTHLHTLHHGNHPGSPFASRFKVLVTRLQSIHDSVIWPLYYIYCRTFPGMHGKGIQIHSMFPKGTSCSLQKPNLYFILICVESLLLKDFNQRLHFLTKAAVLEQKNVYAKLGENVSLLGDIINIFYT